MQGVTGSNVVRLSTMNKKKVGPLIPLADLKKVVSGLAAVPKHKSETNGLTPQREPKPKPEKDPPPSRQRHITRREKKTRPNRGRGR